MCASLAEILFRDTKKKYTLGRSSGVTQKVENNDALINNTYVGSFYALKYKCCLRREISSARIQFHRPCYEEML